MKFESTEDALKYFAESQIAISKMDQDLKAAVAKYKAETKEYFGIEDGKPMDLIQLANMIIRFNLNLGSIPENKTDHSEFTGAPV